MASRLIEAAAHSTLNDPPRAPAAIVLGIDPGTECTGYAVLRRQGPALCEAGLIHTRGDRPFSRRLKELHEGVDEVLRRHEPGLVAVEDLFAHYKHPRTAIKMGHARGVVLLAAAQRGIDVISIPATRIKKTLTGNGHASKAQMQRAISATLGLAGPPPSADMADAIAAAWCACQETMRQHATLAGASAGSKAT